MIDDRSVANSTRGEGVQTHGKAKSQETALLYQKGRWKAHFRKLAMGRGRGAASGVMKQKKYTGGNPPRNKKKSHNSQGSKRQVWKKINLLE